MTHGPKTDAFYASLPLTRALSGPASKAVAALRRAVFRRHAGLTAVSELERLWGDPTVARRFWILAETIGQCWPEPFALSPPCCPRTSFDEALLAGMIDAATHHDQVQFDWLTQEMLGSDARQMLFNALNLFVDDLQRLEGHTNR